MLQLLIHFSLFLSISAVEPVCRSFRFFQPAQQRRFKTTKDSVPLKSVIITFSGIKPKRVNAIQYGSQQTD
ncbi:hypothetical protein, partial [Erwinia amylovora]|uniref:hypothetical protein n=1 Tax=Erwinia amylovora TaxID=552 RepID=UPI001CECF3FC